MAVSADRLLSAPNDSLGSPIGFISPYVIDAIALGIVLLMVFSDFSNPLVNIGGYSIAGAFALWAALKAKAIHRYITDTPRSKTVSAAQGFAELQGTCEFYGNREIQGFMSGPPCVWHRYFILRPRPIPLQIGASTLPFVIRDNTGLCVVDPNRAKVISASKRSWTSAGAFFSSKYIHYGAKMYVIGEIRAERCPVTSYNENAEVANLLRRWKQDKPWMLEEFDTDHNGELDSQEWNSAVTRAKNISRDLFDQKTTDRVENVIRKPCNGMPMLISDQHPDDLAARFSLLSLFNFAVTAGCFLVAYTLCT
ncbi:hypothetical protein AB833_32540 [Chromatiales bacterium (ex Bugula neritina AB1)]|nr:hypothetical protein AB833_32540 [Chromatiales bacterium (ex Bugula neritina AB1)]